MQRKLAAILSADVVGYSGLMESDEMGTLERLKANRAAIFDPHVLAHGGRIFKLMGDGALAEFSSVVASVRCATAIQDATAQAEPDLAETKPIRYRIGINLGDIIVDGDDIYGDGVNIAARLQTLAPVGGIAISRIVRDQVKGRLPYEFDDMGEHTVKNIDAPVHVFNIRLPGVHAAAPPAASRRLSVCVLPFTNISGEVEQEYFTDGITEDVITDLSKISALGVVARNTAFQFKGKSVDVQHIARQLKVSHVLEGSVRKAGGRLRITAQLIDGVTGEHLWAERYDRDLNDIFALQDEISQAIVKALSLKLLPEEKKAIEQRGTTNLEAYSRFLMARQLYLRDKFSTARGSETITRLVKGAIALDTNYARAWALLALIQSMHPDMETTSDGGATAADRAMMLDGSLAEAHAAKARVLMDRGDHEAAQAEFEIAMQLDPDSPEANINLGILYMIQHRFAEAIPRLEKAKVLFDPSYAPVRILMDVYIGMGDSARARREAEILLALTQDFLAREPDDGTAIGFMALALAVLGDIPRAKELVERGLLLDPDNSSMKYVFVRVLAEAGAMDSALDLLATLLPAYRQARLHEMMSMAHLRTLQGSSRFRDMIAAAEASLTH